MDAKGSVPVRHRLTLAILLFLAFGALFALAELAVRVRHTLKIGTVWGVEDTFTADKATGLRIPEPNGNFGPIQINSAGFRSPEIPLRKPDHGVRIAFLGGSTTYCAEVSGNAATWPHLVWQAIRDRWPEVPIDYLNGGVSGYTVHSIQMRLERQIRDFAPDVIVIYEAANDLAGNARKQAEEMGGFLGGEEGQMSLLSRHSLLAYLVEKNLMLWRRQSVDTGKLTLDEMRLTSPFRRDLTALVAASRAVAPVVALATFSPRMRAGQSPAELRAAAASALFYMPYLKPEDILRHYRAYNAVIRDVAVDQGVILIGDEDGVPSDGDHYVDSVHFTDAGARAMAHRVVKGLLAAPDLARLVEARTGKASLRGPEAAELRR